MGRRFEGVVDPDEGLMDVVVRFRHDPLGFVRAVFPWGESGFLVQEGGPDEWQVEALRRLGVASERAEVDPNAEAFRLAIVSGHGVGKTAFNAWVVLWFISTRVNPQIVVTANTTSQLATKTWRELAKWHRMMLHGDWFQWTATKFFLKASPETWAAHAVPWSKERAEAFAGTHERHVLMLFDEASAIDDEIWEVAEGALTTPGAMWVVTGNGTRSKGRFRECFGKFAHRWSRMHVDSRTAKKANRRQIEQWLEDYGEESDFFRVRVKGDFPEVGSTQFIGQDIVDAAVRRWKEANRRKREDAERRGVPFVPLCADDVEDPTEPLILGVDPARFGSNETVLYERRGWFGRVVLRKQGLTTEQVAAEVVRYVKEFSPDAVFIDETGVGGGVVDACRGLGIEVIGVNPGESALDKRRYYNRRIEMWDLMKGWLSKRGVLPEDGKLLEELTAPEYGYAGRHSLMQLESKTDMVNRGVASPDAADALAYTFAMPVARRVVETRQSEMIRRLRREQESSISWMAF
jgi:hypothetical protein